jgi:hypothetical protein
MASQSFSLRDLPPLQKPARLALVSALANNVITPTPADRAIVPADHHPGYHVWQAVRDHCQDNRRAHKNTQRRSGMRLATQSTNRRAVAIVSRALAAETCEPGPV